MYSNEEYKEFDELTNAILVNIFTLSKDSGVINFSKIRFNDKAHLCVLRIAEHLKSFEDKEICVGKANLIRLYLYNKKRKTKIKLAKAGKLNYIDIDELIDFTCASRGGKEKLVQAYEAFFEGK